MIDTIKLNRNSIVTLYKTVASRKDATFGPKFSFFILRNLKFMEEEITIIDEITTQIQTSLQKFNEAKINLGREYSDKDESGNPILINDETAFSITERNADFQNAYLDLEQEYMSDIEKHNSLQEQLNEVLTEEIEQKVLKISYLDIPKEEFNIGELSKLSKFFKETEEELDEMIMG